MNTIVAPLKMDMEGPAVRDLQDKGEAESAEELVKLVLKRMAAGR